MALRHTTDPVDTGYLRRGWLRIDVKPGMEFPRGYGLAFHLWTEDRAATYPLGINWLVAYADRFVCWLRRPPLEQALTQLVRSAHQRALARYSEGWKEGYEIGKKDGVAEFTNGILKDLDARRTRA